MKWCVIFIPVLFPLVCSGQISTSENILAQIFNKDVTEYKVKSYIVNKILNVQEQEPVLVKIDAITSSTSGELTSVVYGCEEQNKIGLVFCFWRSLITTSNMEYSGYGFLNIPELEAEDLFSKLAILLNSEEDNIKKHEDNLVYKWKDLTFIFYKGKDHKNKDIRVLWGTFDAEWNKSNLARTIKRFRKFVDNN